MCETKVVQNIPSYSHIFFYFGPKNVYFFIINQSISQNQGFWALSPSFRQNEKKYNCNLEHIEQLLFYIFYSDDFHFSALL